MHTTHSRRHRNVFEVVRGVVQSLQCVRHIVRVREVVMWLAIQHFINLQQMIYSQECISSQVYHLHKIHIGGRLALGEV